MNAGAPELAQMTRAAGTRPLVTEGFPTTFPVLQDKVGIVTGAAMGMGEVTARLFAEAGARVIVADFNAEKGEAVAADIRASGGEAQFVQVDISNGAQAEAMVAKTVEHYGRLDVAVNNAALSPDQNLTSEIDEDYWDRLMAVDFKVTALTQKYELRQMIAQGDGGSIINISSVSGFRPQPTTPAYVAAKHGVVGLTKTAAMENGPHGIRVNSVAPGAVDTRCSGLRSSSSTSTRSSIRSSCRCSTASRSRSRSRRRVSGSRATPRRTSPARPSTSTAATRAPCNRTPKSLGPVPVRGPGLLHSALAEQPDELLDLREPRAQRIGRGDGEHDGRGGEQRDRDDREQPHDPSSHAPTVVARHPGH